MVPENSTTSTDFGDRRVFFKHDPRTVRMLAGGGNLYFSQSANGPTQVFINRRVSDVTLAMMADRHGLVLDELRYFRDQDEEKSMLATAANTLNCDAFRCANSRPALVLIQASRV